MASQMGSGGSSTGGSGCSEDNAGFDSQNGRKNYHRHTPQQIQRLEAFYKLCPHPEESQRRQLGIELGLEPRQIKFWFQNKRTQTKAQIDRLDNDALRSENDRIRSENMALRETLKSFVCLSCRDPSSVEEKKKRVEELQQGNAMLKLEYERLSTILVEYMGRRVPGVTFNLQDGSLVADQGSGTPAFMVNSLIGNINADNRNLAYQMKANPEIGKSYMAEIAASAINELNKLLRFDQPLWIKSPKDDQYVLDRDSYEKISPQSTGLRFPKSRTESSKDSGVVVMNARLLVDLYLDADKWADLFPTVVSEARTIDVIEAGLLGDRSGSLQLIYERRHALSPLIQPREFHVLRYCQKIETGIWVIVDVSCDCYGGKSHASPICCWKHPSGCMIQEMPNGFSKVTYIEHIEVDGDSQLHPVYGDPVDSALGFGAKRWIATLQRTCERYGYLIEAGRLGHELGGGRSMVMLACRMVKSFCSIFSLFGTADSRRLSELTNHRLQIAVRSNTCPGRPVGIVISAARCFWVPASPLGVFNFLNDYLLRSQWDVLCYGDSVREVMQIPTGRNSANRISVLQPQTSRENIMIFQESMVEQLDSVIVYAPIDKTTMTELANGADSTTIPVLASGFVVTTDGPDHRADSTSSSRSLRGCGGSVLTVAFQILASSSLSTKNVDMIMISKVESFVNRTVRVIKAGINRSAS